jgi:hypothetical protein
VVPDEVHGFGDDGDGDVEEDQAEGDCQPEEEGDDPSKVRSVEGETCNPPAVRVSVYQEVLEVGGIGIHPRFRGTGGLPGDLSWRTGRKRIC